MPARVWSIVVASRTPPSMTTVPAGDKRSVLSTPTRPSSLMLKSPVPLNPTVTSPVLRHKDPASDTVTMPNSPTPSPKIASPSWFNRPPFLTNRFPPAGPSVPGPSLTTSRPKSPLPPAASPT